MPESKYAKHKNRIVDLAKEFDYKPYLVAKELSKELGILSERKKPGNAIYSYCKKVINGSEQKESVESSTKPNDYKKKFVLSAWNQETGQMMDIDNYCIHYSLPRKDISSYKLVSHTGTPYYNIVFKENIENGVEEIDFDKIISKYIKPFKITPVIKDTGVYSFDRLVYTDVHIGMTTNKNGYSLYGGKWDEEEIKRRLDVMIQHTLENKKSNILTIDDLGDFMDGWDGETVRKGHSLPQNMDNEKAFEVGLEFKIKMIDCLAPHYSKIICNNICNDNHAGSFGYVVNRAFKRFVEVRYSHVIVNNIRKFIDHYLFGKNCFILTHGKDGHNLKFGFKPILDTKQIEKIDNYIKEHDLHQYVLEFSKGDSHQKIFDESTSDTFNYYNYGAFSPSSEWVQTNFKKGASFFELFNFKKDGQKLHAPYKFKWNTFRAEKTIDYSDS